MQTVTMSAGDVHAARAKHQANGDWLTLCGRRLGTAYGMFYNVDETPKIPTCLWCAAAEYRR